MTPIEHIRRERLKLSQADFAAVAKTTQATISRWEREDAAPSWRAMGHIRAYAVRKNIPWQDSWFWDNPPKPNGRAR